MITINISSFLIFITKVLITLTVVGLILQVVGEIGFAISRSQRLLNFWSAFSKNAASVAKFASAILIIGGILFAIMMILWYMWTGW